MSVTSAIDNLKDEMQKAGIKSENGLGTELFLFSSTLIPVVNVDLLLTNSKHEILLAWRDDPHTGKSELYRAILFIAMEVCFRRMRHRKHWRILAIRTKPLMCLAFCRV